MRMRALATMTLAMALACPVGMSPTPARAQNSIVWSDVDCSQSKLIASAGVRCRETNVHGARGLAGSAGAGQFKAWSSFGTINGAKLYYYVNQSLGNSASVVPAALVDDLKVVSPQGKGATNFSELTKRGRADFVTFVGGASENCVGIRKTGTATGVGYSWILYATRCVASTQKAPDADIDAFISATDFRP